MVKGNNMIPNGSKRRHWMSFVKSYFNQKSKKLKRRKARDLKRVAAEMRPIDHLRPEVHPPTTRHNIRIRAGRGFTREELKGAGISPKVAVTIGIAVDKRRHNHCEESLVRNVDRLKAYKARLVVFPRDRKTPKKGFGGMPDDSLFQDVAGTLSTVSIAAAMPVNTALPMDQARAITKEDREFSAVGALKTARWGKKKKAYIAKLREEKAEKAEKEKK